MLCGGWKSEPSLPSWWDRFFLGVLSAEEPGAVLTVPARGSTFGVFYGMDRSYGTFFASVDEAVPLHVTPNNRAGYGYSILARDLPAGEHRVSFALPPKTEGLVPGVNGPVKLGWLLVAGKGTRRAPKPGPYPPCQLAKMRYLPVLNAQWKWAGPFNAAPGDGQSDAAIIGAMKTIFPPEEDKAGVEWKSVDVGEEGRVDFERLTGGSRAICYAEAEVEVKEPGGALLALVCDYYGKVWLNGTVVRSVLGSHGSSESELLTPVRLKAGKNQLRVKIGGGSRGFNFSAGFWR